MNPDNYYNRMEVSNSDLSWLQNQLHPRDLPDPTNAYRMGSLLDAMITEPHRVNYFTRCLDGQQYTPAEFETAERMKRAFEKDAFCTDMRRHASPQNVMARRLELNHEGVDFNIFMRCKWDLWIPAIGSGGDIKTTTAETQSQFEAAIRYFDYDRQRAVYMTIGEASQDVLIGISKVNFIIFKVFINRNSELYRTGMDKFTSLAFRWVLYFGEDKRALKTI